MNIKPLDVQMHTLVHIFLMTNFIQSTRYNVIQGNVMIYLYAKCKKYEFSMDTKTNKFLVHLHTV